MAPHDHDLLSEDLKPLTVIRKQLPSAHGTGPVHLSTLHRWASRGVRRKSDGQLVKLQVIRLGSMVTTSTEALRRFLDALNEPASDKSQIETPAANQRKARAAAKKLEAVLA